MLFRIAVAVAVIGVLVWWLKGRGDSPSARSAGAGSADRVVPVQVATVERKNVPIWIDGLGSIAAFQQVTVRPQVDGRLEKVLFTEGQPVKRGDIVAQIDPRPFIVQLHQAQGALARDRAQLLTAKQSYERYRSLKEQNLVSAQQVEQFQGQVGQFEGAIRMDEAQVENAQLQVDYAQVKAPLDGITGIRQVDAGNIVHASDAGGLVVITAIDPAAMFFTVPQDNLPLIVAAQGRGEVPVEAWNRDGTQQLGAGTLAVVDNTINQTTATLRLKALVPNSSRTLWPNEFVKARMLVETRENAIVVPTVAVQHGPQGPFVYVVGADGTAQLRPITVSITTGEQTLIEKGLGGGEQVVIEGQNQLRPGSKVSTGKSGGPGATHGSGEPHPTRPPTPSASAGSSVGPTAKTEESAAP
ncbi:MAG: putative Co/Zn/Cd efflux system rane fusion protein [Myxococcales bacterium]|nr:putative Co/Zn/Cd efflux system rane fusion protein [Myxococcales bacterium]